MSIKKSPCLKCKDRKVNCSMSCELYLKWKKNLKEAKDRIKRNHRRYTNYTDTEFDKYFNEC